MIPLLAGSPPKRSGARSHYRASAPPHLMTQLTQKEFEQSASDKADLALVDYYLKIGDDESLLQRTPVVCPTAGEHDPGKLFRDAEDLHLQSVGAAARLRKRLLLGMNQNTLRELADRVLDPELLFEYVFISGRQDSLTRLEEDPVRGPVLEMIRQRALLPKPKDLEMEEKLESASEQPYPGLPCELEKALKWATDDPNVPFKILERAFFDWTTTVVESTGMRKSTMERHRTSFKPDGRRQRRQKKLTDQAKNLIAVALGDPPRVKFESHLLFFRTEFRRFWKKHATAYKQQAEKRSFTNRELAPGGPTSRMRTVWADRTEAFVRGIQGHDLPRSGTDEWNMLVNKFAESQPSDRRTQVKICGFIKTLYAHASEPLSDELISTLIELLKLEKISAVDEETIRSCMKILSSAMAH